MSKRPKIMHEANKPRDVCGEICDAGYFLTFNRDEIGMYYGRATNGETTFHRKGITTWNVAKEIWELIYE